MNRKMMKKLPSGFTTLAFIGIALILLSGCSVLKSKKSTPPGSSPSGTAAESAPVYYDFGDIMLPRELKVEKKDSFVFRTPGLTAGVLALTGRVEINSLIAFFENKMPVDGWRMISAFKSPRTMMLFQKQTRWCVINITEGQFSTQVEIWVAPTISADGMEMGLQK